MSARVLIVDDEHNIVDILKVNLEREGYTTLTAYDGEQAIEIGLAQKPDLILLDCMLPKVDGFDVCRKLRQSSTAPILMLTAKSEEIDKVLGLELGADDYITKPFGLRELFARIEAVLRRSGSLVQPAGASVLRLQDITIDTEGFSVEKGNARIALSPTEYSLLSQLARSAGKVLGRGELMEALDLGTESTGGRSLDVHLRNLRRKLGESPGADGYIGTVRGFGLKANS